MNRKENWPELMQAYFLKVRHAPLAWGQFDPFIFILSCVIAMTGESIEGWPRGYATEDAAFYGIGDDLLAFVQTIAAKHGWEQIDNPLSVQRGDIIMANTDVVDAALGICAGTISLFPGKAGLVGHSTIETPGTPPTVLHAWRIKVARG